MLISACTNLYILDKSNKGSILEAELMQDFNTKVKEMFLECELTVWLCSPRNKFLYA